MNNNELEARILALKEEYEKRREKIIELIVNQEPETLEISNSYGRLDTIERILYDLEELLK